MAAVRRTAGEGPAREFKYSQEISQMVRSVTVKVTFYQITQIPSIPFKMFVFGEVQDPNMETLNLVEDIVRSQLIELVKLNSLPRF